ncbi:hypothetical protein PLESTB_000464000 [Pleodorina starrii]|uniref:1,3-beta-glucan synthase n=1 Tax=Pleodorina starrii TaxID=330485 RepID=A0A9W6BGJ5_9CHLO|nr:hypothetical protein PLESTM_000798500 [Pleodorina starrii]GLC51081.1 hypothetical protein PLESTB_000464000 [Pleodorina starrii]
METSPPSLHGSPKPGPEHGLRFVSVAPASVPVAAPPAPDTAPAAVPPPQPEKDLLNRLGQQPTPRPKYPAAQPPPPCPPSARRLYNPFTGRLGPAQVSTHGHNHGPPPPPHRRTISSSTDASLASLLRPGASRATTSIHSRLSSILKPQLPSSSIPYIPPLPAPAPAPALPEPPAAVARRPLCDRIHNTTWAVARAFGFQAFNPREEPQPGSSPQPQWVASTAFLAADHLEALLVRNIMPRLILTEQQQQGEDEQKAGGEDQQQDQAATHQQTAEPCPQRQDRAFARAVWDLHSHIFLSYEGAGGWCRKVGLSARPAAVEAEVLSQQHGAADREVVALLLSELALYFLLYSEAANLRHTPELMWFLFWAAVHSPAMERLWRGGLRPEQQLSNARQRRLAMRNSLAAQLRTAQEKLGHDPAANCPERCAQAADQLASQLPTLMPDLDLPSDPPDAGPQQAPPASSASSPSSDLALPCPASRELFSDLACYGDGGFWTDVLVSPLFTVLAYEVDHCASSGAEVAHRLGYDDVNESMCRRDVMVKLLAALGVSEAAAGGDKAHGALDALTRLGCPPTVTSAGGDGAAPASAAPDPRRFDPVLAGAFWSNGVLIKTHRERRSWLALLRAFYRVYSLQLVLMHGTMAWAFAPGSPRALSSVVVTHAVVAALERTANWWLTRGTRDPLQAARVREGWLTAPLQDQKPAPAADEEARGGGAATATSADGGDKSSFPSDEPRRCPLSGSSAVDARMERRRQVAVEGSPVWGVFGWLEWVLLAVAVLVMFTMQYMGPPSLRELARSYWPLMAGGYAAVVFVHGLLTTRDGYCLSLSEALRLPAALRASSQRPTPGCWLHRPMSVGWRAAALTALFWLQVFAAKLGFDYFVIMKPIAGQVRYILRRNWLATCAPGQSHIRLLGAQLPLRCVDGDWLLVTLRAAPFVLVCLVDTQIFYQLMLMMWGLVHGLMSLNLGIAGSWDGLREEFHRAPLRWWAACMSDTANKAALAAAAAAKRRRREAEEAATAPDAKPACVGARSEDEGSEYGDVCDVGSSSLSYFRGMDTVRSSTSRIGTSVGGKGASGPKRLAAAEASSGPGGLQAPAAGSTNGDASSEASSSVVGGKGLKTGKPKGRRSRREAAIAELVVMLSGQGDEQLAQWMAFAAAWDAVVDDLRSCDLISDRERSNLVFTRLPAAATTMGVARPTVTATAAASGSDSGAYDVAPSSQSDTGSGETGSAGADPSSGANPVGAARPLRPFLLPAFFYAGQIQRVVDGGSATPSQQLVLGELRSLLVWLGCQLRLLEGPTAAALLAAPCCPTVLDAAHSRSRERGLAAMRTFVAAMQTHAQPLPSPAGAAKEARQLRSTLASEAVTALGDVLEAIEVEAKAVIKVQVAAAKKNKKKDNKNSSSGSSGSGGSSGPQQDGQEPAADPLAAALALLEAAAALRSGLLARPERISAALALLQPEHGGSGEVPTTTTSAGSSSVSIDLTLLVRMLSTASKMLNLSTTAAQPTGAEARRILGFFVTSLANRQLVKPCPLAAMPSWTVLTPLYAEDVMFPLEASRVAEALGLAQPKPKPVAAHKFGTAPPTSSSSSAHLLPDLLSETEDRVSLLAYIRSLYPKDWDNFKERLGASLGGVDLGTATEADFATGGPLAAHALALQLWASYRGQLLARTVRGMAAYERALRVLAALEGPRPGGSSRAEHAAAIEDCVGAKFTHVVASQLYGNNRRSSNLRDRWLAESTDVLLEAFPYLRVSYLDTVPNAIAKAEGVADADAATGGVEPPPTHQYAVLIRGRRRRTSPAEGGGGSGGGGRTEELYRVRLPYNRYSKRGIILGEGKPENQNHAAIFCFGEALQTIDMNQDNALAEALKMRNLLGELQPERITRQAKKAEAALQTALGLSGAGSSSSSGGASHAPASAPASALPPAAELKRLLGELRDAERPVAVVGFREWVFSDKAGALGSFAASSEYAFSTMVQRNMAYPANVRLHYGHPDAFNKLFVMTRGGVAKATRQLHVSEDIFGGMNHSLRGGLVKFREYIACGKGRDMGFDSINAFESKISAGFGEVALSRDLLRMATRLDLWRCLHLYHSLAGNYFNTWLVMGSVYAQVYAVLFFALGRATVYRHVVYFPSPPPPPPGAAATAPPPPGAGPALPGIVRDVYSYDTIRVEHVLQLGLLLLLPYMAEMALEVGLVRGLLAAVAQVLSGSFTFFIFKQQTTAAALHRSMLYGGATYIATGRGFSITSSSFIKLFANYGRSHIALGFELAAMAMAVAANLECVACSYVGLTWGTWLAAVSLLLAPCWFNPMAFSPTKVRRDMHAWVAWLRGETDRELGLTWHQWNRRQLADSRDDAGLQTDRWANVAQNLALRAMPPALLALAAASGLTLRLDQLPGGGLPGPFRNEAACFLVASALMWGLLAAVLSAARYANEYRDQRHWRLWSFWLSSASAGGAVVFLVGLSGWYSGNGLSNLLLIAYANANLLLAVHRVAEQLAPRSGSARRLVDSTYWVIDASLGWLLLGLCGALSLTGFVGRLQTKLLFNVTFATSVKRGRLVKTIGLAEAERGGQRRDAVLALLTMHPEEGREAEGQGHGGSGVVRRSGGGPSEAAGGSGSGGISSRAAVSSVRQGVQA